MTAYIVVKVECIRVRFSQKYLDRFRKANTDFVRWFITTDGSWVYHSDPDLQHQTAEWPEPCCSALMIEVESKVV